MLLRNKNTIHLSHTDLDGEGCVILAQNYLKNSLYKRISYNSLLETLKEIVLELESSNDSLQLLITDLKMSKDDFDFLQSKSNLFSKIVIIDHHLYEFEIPQIENANVYINTEYCATALTYKYFSNMMDLSPYKRFVKLVNTFDLWKYKSLDFEEAKVLNRLYWHMGYRNFNRRFFFTPKITDSMRTQAKEILNEIGEYFKSCEKSGALFYNPLVTVSLCDKHIGELKEFYDSKVLINLKNMYHYSIRFSDDLSDEVCEKLRTAILENVSDEICKNKGGHLRAFGVTMNEMDSVTARAETEKYAKVCSDILNTL